MKRIALALLALLGATTALWLASDAGPLTALTYSALRGPLIQYTGIVALAVMCVSVLLALRPVWLEPALGGLDKSYRLHKWLGVTGLIFAVLHWATIKAPG
jgi:predicted ferric reductase